MPEPCPGSWGHQLTAVGHPLPLRPRKCLQHGGKSTDSRAKLLISIRPQQPGRAGPVLLGGAGFPALPGAQWPRGSGEEVGGGG